MATWGAYIMQTGYQLFLIYIYTEFAYLADTRTRFPVRVFGLGTFAIDLGLLIGFALISYTSIVHAGWVQGEMGKPHARQLEPIEKTLWRHSRSPSAFRRASEKSSGISPAAAHSLPSPTRCACLTTP